MYPGKDKRLVVVVNTKKKEDYSVWKENCLVWGTDSLTFLKDPSKTSTMNQTTSLYAVLTKIMMN